MERRIRTPTAAPAKGPPILDDDVVVEILRAAKAAGVLGLLASSSRQLCTLARSSVPVQLRVMNERQAGLLIAAQAHGRPPFSGCTELVVQATDTASCMLATGVVYAAKQWTALQGLRLSLKPSWTAEQQQPTLPVEYYTSNVLCSLPALQQLRKLQITVPGFGTCSMERVAQLPQLTGLTLVVGRPAAGEAPPDLSALSRLTNLVQLCLVGACVTQPAAAPGRPAHLPSSLIHLALHALPTPHPAVIACWATHLAACPQLRGLHIQYGRRQHHSACPRAIVRLLAQHNRQLRALDITYTKHSAQQVDWSVPVAGLPDAAGPVEGEWRPDDALAALTNLATLQEGHQLRIRGHANWHYLAKLTALEALAGAELHCAPPQQLGAAGVPVQLRVLELNARGVSLSGRDLGLVLQACPLLQWASIQLYGAPAQAAVQPGSPPLLPHPCLTDFTLEGCDTWGNAAAATAQFGALAPVLGGVVDLVMQDWPMDGPAGALPDLSPCTPITSLVFGYMRPQEGGPLPAEQERLLSMVAPLVQLQRLEVCGAPRVSARVAVPLQYMLPQLEQIMLRRCGRLVPEGVHAPGQQQQQDQQEAEALEQVKRLLRPGVHVNTTWAD
jgi:hypothetical protein